MTTVFRECEYVWDPATRCIFHSETYFRGNIYFLESVHLGPNASTVTGNFSQAFGAFNTIQGDYDLVAGSGNKLTGNLGFVSGLKNSVAADYATVVGRYSAPVSEDAVFVIGAGTSESDRYNSLTAYANGYVYCNILAIGSENVGNLVTENVGIDNLTANNAGISALSVQDLQAVAANVQNATIASGVVQALQASALSFSQGTGGSLAVGNLQAVNGCVSSLWAQYGNLSYLFAATANVGNLYTPAANVSQLTSLNGNIFVVASQLGNIRFLQTELGTIQTLNCANANIVSMSISNLMVGSSTAQTVNANSLTAQSSTLGNAQAVNLMTQNLQAATEQVANLQANVLSAQTSVLGVAQAQSVTASSAVLGSAQIANLALANGLSTTTVTASSNLQYSSWKTVLNGSNINTNSIVFPVASGADSVQSITKICSNGPSPFSIRCQVSTNGGSSFDTAGGMYSQTLSSRYNNTQSYVDQTGAPYPTLAAGLAGNLMTHQVRCDVDPGFLNYGQGATVGCILEVTVHGFSAASNCSVRNQGGVYYSSGAPVTHVRLSVENTPSTASMRWGAITQYNQA